jgi:hypothetical protein
MAAPMIGLLAYRRKFDRAGSVEATAQTALARYATARTYERKGHGTSVTAKELFECDFAEALNAVEAQAESALGERWEPTNLTRILERMR